MLLSNQIYLNYNKNINVKIKFRKSHNHLHHYTLRETNHQYSFACAAFSAVRWNIFENKDLPLCITDPAIPYLSLCTTYPGVPYLALCTTKPGTPYLRHLLLILIWALWTVTWTGSVTTSWEPRLMMHLYWPLSFSVALSICRKERRKLLVLFDRNKHNTDYTW